MTHRGSIVDASFVDVPRQRNTRNTRDENKDIRNGDIPEDWEDDPNKLRQKDTDARWTKKNGQSYFGHKNHAKVDRKSKLITNYAASDASVHDSQVLGELLDGNDAHHDLFGDSARSSDDTDKKLKRREIRNRIHEKGYRNNPLNCEQEERNRRKSKIHVRIEHVFGFMENTNEGGFCQVHWDRQSSYCHRSYESDVQSLSKRAVVQGVVCPPLAEMAGQSKKGERQNEKADENGVVLCELLSFHEIRRDFVQ